VTTAFLFPGQGSQRVGMGRAWAEAHAEARVVFEQASAAVGLDLAELCWVGPEETLQLTANTQPAILTVSVAIARVLAARGIEPVAVAGHSLGEYSAHVAAGTLSLADGVRLVRERGTRMQDAVPVGVGAMAAVLGLAPEAAERLAAASAQGEVCAVANYNSAEQTVLAGHRGAIERAVATARDHGAKRAILLPVSAPFHCSLMAPARDGLAPTLAATTFRDPTVPVVVNIDARAVSTGAEARDALVRQIDGPVHWVESIRCLVDQLGVRRLVEVGPGNVLSGLARRIAPECEAISLAEPEALDKLAEGSD